MDNNVKTSEKITKWLLIGISGPVSGSNASPPADHCDHRGSAKRLGSFTLRR